MAKRALIVIDVQNEYFDGALPISDPPTETSLANIGRARQQLGYEPTHTIAQGLGQAIEWYAMRSSLLDAEAAGAGANVA